MSDQGGDGGDFERAELIDVGRSLHILIVEDNADAREMLQAVLEVAGHRVETAGDGVSGVDLAVRGKHELAIVDIGLPGLDGYEVAAKIRAAADGRPPFLIALTGYGGPEQRERALGAGFDVHIVKPVNLDSLLDLIAQISR
jgi:two-component system, sensor histidine kinase